MRETLRDRIRRRAIMEKGAGRGDSDADTNWDADYIEKVRVETDKACSGKSPEWCYGFKRGMDYGRLDCFDDVMNKPTRGKSGDYSEKSGPASDQKAAAVDREAMLYGMSADALTGYKVGYSLGFKLAKEDIGRSLPPNFSHDLAEGKKLPIAKHGTKATISAKPMSFATKSKKMSGGTPVKKLTEGMFKKWAALLFTDSDEEISDEFPATFMYALGAFKAMKAIEGLAKEAKTEFKKILSAADSVEAEEDFVEVLKQLDEFGEAYDLWTPSFVDAYENSEDSEEGEEPEEEIDVQEKYEARRRILRARLIEAKKGKKQAPKPAPKKEAPKSKKPVKR